MLDRYSTPEMTKVWSLENQYASWLEVEITATEAWSHYGLVPVEDAIAIRKNSKFSVKRIADIELSTQHDVVAFTRNVSESLGDERKWVHYGLTSTDVVDTAQGLRLKEANALIIAEIDAYIDELHLMTLKYKNTVMIGRTHGIQAEPTTFGLKMARYYTEALRNRERFIRVANGIETGKLSGAVGTFANVPIEVEIDVMSSLGLQRQPVASQVLPRDLHADYISSLALLATGLENLSVEMRSLARSEIHEVEEGFSHGQKGSSAMPHKRNPIGFENICGLSRIVRGFVTPAFEDIPLWHERDISHSSAERVLLPDVTSLIHYMLRRITKLMKNLQVFPETMLKNMGRTYGLIYSQRLLLMLVNKGLSREKAYDTVQPLTARAWDEGIQFRELVNTDETIISNLSKEEIDDAFDYKWHLRSIDAIYERMGL
ncbi:adenylosuccinate lyase [Lactovum miscens]|uniref:Adenylosuccinate lyase n=1 Tax=Lactovum miscens TaxID=190387 RepID=A0A841C9D5_9LACT|nr:adenylosuccinate lyase [Lactovum miscens]MBB5888202.1 adenylosuccinate lyase [Lactovum miscens]